MLIARRFLVSGRVQGVGFRFFAHATAERENVGGWARNLGDGRVEIFAEGDREAIDRVERAIRRGPRGARVEDVQVFDEPASGSAQGFHIRETE